MSRKNPKDEQIPVAPKKVVRKVKKIEEDEPVPVKAPVKVVQEEPVKLQMKVAPGFRKKVIEDTRKSRGKAQRIFLILTHAYEDDVLERSYDVMGTTGNAYNVCIKTSPTCTCPDYTTRHKRCKHIYFVLSRIMKVTEDQEDIEEYTDDDLRDMLSNIPQITENLRVDAGKIAKFKALKKNGKGEVEMRPINEDDVCAICLGDMYECDEELTYCKYSCGSGIHKDCFDRYTAHRAEGAKCLFCMKQWERQGTAYINLD
ncbi:hypothetical protein YASMINEVIRUS_423 [Yasminevirus sp. GU-2018]|uniref:SWIM-type domain-containing protein n=1 Tax=Yasminevirus sp. GU-2018 TaxID=2420051 RepID=A0A5K0U826_9VIRU|nr:hypothetical protein YASMINEVIRUS_423 [Yasminevirus sp. GU-2018]